MLSNICCLCVRILFFIQLVGVDATEEMERIINELKTHADAGSLDTQDVLGQAIKAKAELEPFSSQINSWRLSEDFPHQKGTLDSLLKSFDNSFQLLLSYHKTLSELEAEQKEAASAAKRKNRTQRDKLRRLFEGGKFPSGVAMTFATFLHEELSKTNEDVCSLANSDACLVSAAYNSDINTADPLDHEFKLPLSVFEVAF